MRVNWRGRENKLNQTLVSDVTYDRAMVFFGFLIIEQWIIEMENQRKNFLFAVSCELFSLISEKTRQMILLIINAIARVHVFYCSLLSSDRFHLALPSWNLSKLKIFLISPPISILHFAPFVTPGKRQLSREKIQFHFFLVNQDKYERIETLLQKL